MTDGKIVTDDEIARLPIVPILKQFFLIENISPIINTLMFVVLTKFQPVFPACRTLDQFLTKFL